MKRIHFTFLGILLCIVYGILSVDLVTHSAELTPADSKYAEKCSNGDGDYDRCCIDYNTALEAVRDDWQNNLQQIIDQEKPASEMVDEGYESLKTYNCWAEYVCRAVQYSGHAPIESALGSGLTSEHLGVVPGCQEPEDLKMEVEYNEVMKAIKQIPIAGVLPNIVEQAFVENKINYFPNCQSDGNNNKDPNIELISDRYSACKRALELSFGCPSDTPEAICVDSSTAFVTLDNVLRKAHADQKSSALEKKLGEIVGKMHSMEAHAGYLQKFLEDLNSRFVCYAEKCD